MSDATITSNPPTYSGTQARAQELLGDGVASNIVAQALGVSESYVSQLLADEIFLKGVVERRYNHLAKHNARDSKYDEIEDKLLKQLESTLPLLMDPMKISRVLSQINSAQRRGQSAPESIQQQNVIVNLTLPTAVIQRFSVVKDVNNQILEAGEQKLVTIQSSTLLDKLRDQNKLENQNDEQSKGNLTTSGSANAG